jgi:hypothetical protein
MNMDNEVDIDTDTNHSITLIASGISTITELEQLMKGVKTDMHNEIIKN